MGAINNLIPRNDRVFLQGSGTIDSPSSLWATDSCTVYNDDLIYRSSEYGSLRIQSTSTDFYVTYNFYAAAGDTIASTAITSVAENGDRLDFHAWFVADRNITAYASVGLWEINNDDELIGAMITGEETPISVLGGSMTSPQWQIGRSLAYFIPTDGKRYSVSVKIRFTQANAEPIVVRMSQPVVQLIFGFTENDFLNLVMPQIPETFREQDVADFAQYGESNDPKFPLTRLIDAATTIAGEITDLRDNFEYLTIELGRDDNNYGTLSTLVNPLVADEAYLYWLSQFQGTTLVRSYEPSTEGLAWESFVLDSSSVGLLGGDPLIPAVGVLASTGGAGQIPGGLEEFFRWQIAGGFYGMNAGSVQAISSATQQVLTGSRLVDITEGVFSVHIKTEIGETFGSELASPGDSSDLVLSITEYTRPLGVQITHELVTTL